MLNRLNYNAIGHFVKENTFSNASKVTTFAYKNTVYRLFPVI